MNGRTTKIHNTCFLAIEDIQKIWAKRNVQISITEASRQLGETYFSLKTRGKGKIISEFP